MTMQMQEADKGMQSECAELVERVAWTTSCTPFPK